MSENNETPISSGEKTLKLNLKRTFIIGFAFFGILMMWQVYDSYISKFLSELFMKTYGITDPEQVQYLVGIMMAIDNIAALIMMPVFGHLSDKTKTPIGKRMPYILVGTFVCALVFPFIPVAFHYSNLTAVIILMAITVFFAMMYRNPAVALMPDLTPKPLRSRANGIINIMGYVGGAIPTVLGMFLVFSKYLGEGGDVPGITGNIWVIETPFLLSSVLMIISVVVLFIKIKENKLEVELKEELEQGEEQAAVVDKVHKGGRMTKANRIMLILILAAEFFWFMADNGVSTFMLNYTTYFLHASTASVSTTTLIGGIASVVGFAFGGIIASKIGRKYTLWSGLGLTILSYFLWYFLTLGSTPDGTFPFYIYIAFVLKGFGMSLVHVNSFPMVVELCPSSKIGKFTGYYYAASMVAQTITPILIGTLMLTPGFGFDTLPLYAGICTLVAFIIFIFVKNVKTKKTTFKKGLEALDNDD